MRGYGPTSRLEVWAIMARAFFRKDRNQVIVGNLILYVVGLALVALVMVPR